MIDRPAPDPTAPHGHRETSGEQVGAYTLLAIVGQGGAGTVWRARRCEPFEQIVALKILKPGMDSEAVIARFDQERQALARLDHPAIARAIAAQGRPDQRRAGARLSTLPRQGAAA